MLETFARFVQRLLANGVFRIADFSQKGYDELVTAAGVASECGWAVLPRQIERAKASPGYLVIDDTNNPKYGLKGKARTLFVPATKGFRSGYRLQLFLWVTERGAFPIAFALWHAESEKLLALALALLGELRNRQGLKPGMVLADAAYGSAAVLKRLDDYRWGLVMRFKGDRKLDGAPVSKRIPRGWGSTVGRLANGVKLKVVRSGGHFLCSNRVSLGNGSVREIYRLRWKVEEAFRFLKTVLKLGGCHQHSIRAQAVFVSLLLSLHCGLVAVSGGNPYQAARDVISGRLDLWKLLQETFPGYA